MLSGGPHWGIETGTKSHKRKRIKPDLAGYVPLEDLTMGVDIKNMTGSDKIPRLKH